MPHLSRRLRTSIVALALVAGLAPIGAVVASTPTPAEAAAPIRVDIAAIESATSSLRYERNYLSAHRTWRAWQPRLSRVSGQFNVIEGQLSGRARTAVASYEAAFLTRARGHRYARAIGVLNTFINRMSAAIENYRRTGVLAIRPFG